MVLLPLLRAAHIGATVLVAGALAFEFLVLSRAARSCDGPVAAVVRRWLALQRGAGVAVALLSWVGWLAALAIGMSGLPAAQALTVDVLGTVVTGTTFGRVWSVRLALMLALAGALAWRGRASSAAGAAPGITEAVLSLGLVLSLAWTGHALGTPPANLLADAVHALAAALWLGMIPPLWLIVRRGAAEPWSECAARAAAGFFRPGVAAVAILAATGVANALRMVGSPDDLVTSPYGRLLAAKLALFAGMLVLAARNSVLARRLSASGEPGGRGAGMASLRRSVAVELACGALVIALVGLLGTTAPAAHRHPQQEPSDPHDRHEMHDTHDMEDAARDAPADRQLPRHGA